jgi:hypothetical protein
MTYPDGIDALVNVNANDSLAAGGHAARHNSVNTALGEVKDFLGTGTGYRYNSTVYFTSNGTFTKADYPWLRAIRVRLVGGGGGGGGAGSTTGSQCAMGSGGGGGGYAERFITDIAGLSASVSVTVGSGGAGGVGVNEGSTGGTSIFGSTQATGGLGGGRKSFDDATTVIPTQPVGGGASGTFDLGLRGSPGSMGICLAVSGDATQAGNGGSSVLGGGAQGRRADVANAGTAGVSPGGGGSGAANGPSVGSNSTGGAGGAGIVIVELFA